MKTEDPVLEELHAARRKHLADWNRNTEAYLRVTQARLEKSGRPIWQGKQRAKYSTAVAEQSIPAGDSPPATR